MKKKLLVSLGTVVTFFGGIISFALFDGLIEFIGLDFSEGFYYDLIIPLVIGLVLSVFFILFIKKRWGLSWTVWIAGLIGIFTAVVVVYLLVSSVPIRR